MRSLTAVEIGADICALARTSAGGGAVHLWAAETLDPAAFPGVEAFTVAVRQTRRTLKLPRRCRAVVWGLPDGASRRDPIVAPLIEPLTKAGFKIVRVVTPCNALGALARLRVSRSGGAMCWLGINRNGVAIVVVRPGKLLYSHSFAWDSNVGASGSQARLLQRYSLVSFLAPEVRRAFAAAHQKGTTVDGIVTCGNLPDLRSLTMPLIEELDVEVETLDSLEGLVVKPDAAEKLAEIAPALRLACAGAIARETRSLDENKRRRVQRSTRVAAVLRVAALVAVLAGAAYWYYWRLRPAATRGAAFTTPKTTANAARPPASSSQLPASSSRPPASSSQPPASSSRPPASSSQPPASQPSASSSQLLPPATGTPPEGGGHKEPERVAPPPSVGSPAAPPASAGRANAPSTTSTPPSVTTPAATTRTTATTNTPSKPAAANPPPPTPTPAIPPGGGRKEPARTPPPVSTPTPVLTPPAQAPKAPTSNLQSPTSNSQPPTSSLQPPPSALRPPSSGTLSSTLPAADKPVATAPAPGAGPTASRRMPPLLKDPVPRVTAILVSADRRFATVGDEGQIIGVGDTIGRRVVVGIDDKTVLLREPSGVRIRVGLGGRVVGVERADR